MSALLESIALSYAKSKGLSYITDEAREYAAKKLGVDTKNPKYAISIGNMKIDPMKMITNQAIKSAIGGGKIGMGLPLLAAGLGLAYMRNPLREGSMNYNPELQGQIDYLSGMNNMIGPNQGSGLLQYGPESVLRGKNVVSMFGTNDYAKQLQKFINKMEARKTKGYNTIGIGPFKTKTTNFTEGQQKLLDKAKTELDNFDWDETDKFMENEQKKEKRKTYSAPYQGQVHGNGNGNNSGSNTNTSKTSGSVKEGAFGAYDGSKGRKDFRRGGIASL